MSRFISFLAAAFLLEIIAPSEGTATCFRGEALVVTTEGTKKVADLKPGDKAQVLNQNNQLDFSPVMFQIHPQNNEEALFRVIITKRGHTLHLTNEHLIFFSPGCINRDVKQAKSKHAVGVKVGDCVFVSKSADGVDEPDIDVVIKVKTAYASGIYAPVTKDGTIVVDNVWASCYSFVQDHKQAHRLFSVFKYFPQKGWKNLEEMFHQMTTEELGTWLISLSRRLHLSEDHGICIKGKKPIKEQKPE